MAATRITILGAGFAGLELSTQLSEALGRGGTQRSLQPGCLVVRK